MLRVLGRALSRHRNRDREASYPNALNRQTLGLISLGANYYFAKNALKVTLDGGWALTPVGFTFGLFGQSIGAGDWRASQTGEGSGEFVIRLQTQLLF